MRYAPWVIIGTAAVVFVSLFFVVAPYGRHTRKGWGPTVPARWGWLLMETPAFASFAWAFWNNPTRDVVLGALWLGHCGYRAYVYPWRVKGDMPAVTALLAIAFNVPNGLANGAGASAQGGWRYLLGIAMFLCGFSTHVHSDAVLRQLRGTGYAVPQRGLHRLVAAPNYFGEIVQWSGYALAAWNLPALAFAIFTFANLAPRARSHLGWYREKFGAAYPKGRRALVPWLF